MFLFLSKLLPLLVYPLGLTCILLSLSLVWLWKKPRRAAAAIATALILLIISSNPWVSAQAVRTLEWQYLPLAKLPTAEAIVVLGGSIYPAMPPRPWVEVADAGDRVLYGVRLYQTQKAPLIIFSGGRINWKDGGPPEAEDMAKIATAMGVPANAIINEGTSLNTYQNAVNVKEILQRRQLKKILLVTSAIHMPRSMAIFKKQGIDAIPAPTDYWVTERTFEEINSSPQASLLNALPDTESLHYFTRTLKEYIGFGVYRFKGWL
ncbi:MAG: YdcF family protein [Cyanobacteria bacterium P01_A01_bin.114]